MSAAFDRKEQGAELDQEEQEAEPDHQRHEPHHPLLESVSEIDGGRRSASHVVQRGVAAGDLRPGADPRWLGMVLAGLLTTAVRAAGAAVIDVDQAGDLVSEGLFDGFGS